jgi:predicted RNase H-like HicB family nuclease
MSEQSKRAQETARPSIPTTPGGPGILGRETSVKLSITLERDETGMIVAECPAIPGCVSQGKTEEEALANIREAIVACLEVRAEQGLPLTVRTVEIDVSVA